ncbi:unnamed protein product [Prorocentrum cordatum]|uniref:Tyrosine specific protein phosphatases domain-containing protein n=1 Tax=Prorocentrum cordatum TaxID=2364126 RepID=A0ABN9YDN4_9DINO|nr:unnamed protein product [Polarella glacialis]
MELVTLIPHRLSYGPAGSAASDQARLAFDDITAPEFRQGLYEVCHYPRSALRGCVGPLAIDQTLWFSHELNERLNDEGKLIVVEYRNEDRQNVAVVVGAYLMLGLGWSAREVCGTLPKDAGLTFPCSWIEPGDLRTARGKPLMTVQDCWEGVQMARDLGWLRKETVNDGIMASLAASQFWKTNCEYDAAWLVPGAVVVMADPMTTIKDPNPKTCPAFGDGKLQGSDDNWETGSLDDLRRQSVCDSSPSRPSSPNVAFHEKVSDFVPGTTPSTTDGRDSDEFQKGQRDSASVLTVCKVYGSGDALARGCDLWPGARPFVDFLLEEGIKIVVRVNMSDEPGSYDAGLLADVGIQHADVPVSDSKHPSNKGGVPPPAAIKRFFTLTRHMAAEDGGAVLVHCKGGFGRSVFLACLFVIHKYNVSGRGLLGWARIARPGALTTPEQESVLRSLSGRVDLCRRYGIPCEGPADTPAAKGCCTVS